VLLDCKYIEALSPFAVTEILNTVDSTNIYAKTYLTNNRPLSYVCLAEKQTAARGRYGKVWQSGIGNINLSCAIGVSAISKVQALSLAVGVILINFLKQYIHTDSIKVKWPNDLLYVEKDNYKTSAKLAGILIELVNNYAIIGIGLNIQPQYNDSIKQPITSLTEILNTPVDINKLVTNLLQNVHHYLEIFMQTGFRYFQYSWNQNNAFQDKMIKVIKNQEELLCGTCVGVNVQGQLLIAISNNIHTIDDISLSISLK
jgi:BirA family transcriptional regulator, biotin operon repressor / biotin---[acetyl-CoA-carboxylase] ligase